MPKRFSKLQHAEMMTLLEKRDGWKCQKCGKVPPKDCKVVNDRLEIDHMIAVGSLQNGALGAGAPRRAALDDPRLLRLLCGRCNRRRQFEGKLSIMQALGVTVSLSPSPHARSTDTNGSTRKPDPSDTSEPPSANPTVEARRHIDYGAGPAQMQANNAYEPLFIAYVNSKVRQAGDKHLSHRDLVAGGAFIVGCSIATAEDYMAKLVGPEGPLERYKVGNMWLVKQR